MSRGADPFADAIESYWRTGKGRIRYKRDDGWSQIEDAWWYFASFRNFPSFEKKALAYAKGRVLDLGCGAGRHTLYLQSRGSKVFAFDTSARIAMIARSRGVRRIGVASACEVLPLSACRFDTVLLLGNNLGFCGGSKQTARLLHEIARVTRPHAHIIATTRAPGASSKRDVEYWAKQTTKGTEFGRLKLRLDFRGRHPRWVWIYLVSPEDLALFAWTNGWAVTRVFGEEEAEEGYAVVMEKRA